MVASPRRLRRPTAPKPYTVEAIRGRQADRGDHQVTNDTLSSRFMAARPGWVFRGLVRAVVGGRSYRWQ